MGGSTYAFDVWPGHPHEADVLGLLRGLRAQVGALLQQVRAYNTSHARPRSYTEVTFYGGQWLLEREDAEELEYEIEQAT